MSGVVGRHLTTWGAVPRGAVASALLGVVAGGSLPAQPASSVLDTWLVLRYRTVQLLPENATLRPQVGRGPLLRVEAVRSGARADTLIAVHFVSGPGAPAFASDARVHVTAPTGAVAPLTGRVVERRPFRVSATPVPPARATRRPDNPWRYGWSYLVVVPRRAAGTGPDAASAARYRGWLLLEAPSTPAR